MKAFDCKDYLDLLRHSLDQNKKTRGYHAQLAKAAEMHPSYLSRILHGSIHLTPDQAAGLVQFWGMGRDEANYFLALVNWARAGSGRLRKMIEAEMKELKAKHENLSQRLPAEKMDQKKENLYYSAWYYGAVHVLLTIPQYQTESAIAERLSLPTARVRMILEALEQLGLAQKNRNKWETTKSNIHLSNDSWMASVYHSNWRSKMAEKVQFRDPEDLHYSALHTLSRSDFKRIKDLLLETLVQADSIVRPSKEEDVACLLIDWSLI